MAKAVEEVHQKNIAHNDIKDNNFFLYELDYKRNIIKLKLSDFGYARD